MAVYTPALDEPNPEGRFLDFNTSIKYYGTDFHLLFQSKRKASELHFSTFQSISKDFQLATQYLYHLKKKDHVRIFPKSLSINCIAHFPRLSISPQSPRPMSEPYHVNRRCSHCHHSQHHYPSHPKRPRKRKDSRQHFPSLRRACAFLNIVPPISRFVFYTPRSGYPFDVAWKTAKKHGSTACCVLCSYLGRCTYYESKQTSANECK